MQATQEQLEYQSAFQKILINLATSFINLPIDQMDDAITEVLRQLVEFFGAMNSSINQFNDDHSRFAQIYRWGATNNPRSYPREETVPDDELVEASILQQKVLAVADIADLLSSSELAQFLQKYGIVALITLPLIRNDRLFGFISISWDHPRHSDPRTVDLLQMAGEIFLNALNS